MTTTVHPQQKSTSLSHRWFARLWSSLEAGVDVESGPAKDSVFVDLPTQVVEIGPGLGSNLKRYRPGTTVIAFEPNRFMHDGLRSAASENGIELDLRATGIEEADLDEASQHAVVSSFTLCSVEDVAHALAGIRRILKPGGRFLFVEHIAADEGTTLARIQSVLRRPWALLADRCNLTAMTHVAIEQAGFSNVQSTIRELGPKLDPSRRTVYGIAIR